MQKYAFAVEVPTLLDIYCDSFGAHLSPFFNPVSRLPSTSPVDCFVPRNDFRRMFLPVAPEASGYFKIFRLLLIFRLLKMNGITTLTEFRTPSEFRTISYLKFHYLCNTNHYHRRRPRKKHKE